MANELLERVRYIIGQIRKDYEALIEEGMSPRDAEVDAVDGWLANNYDTLAVIWAAGQTSEAYEAVYEEVEQVIFEPFCDEE